MSTDAPTAPHAPLASAVGDVQPRTAREWLDAGEAILIDVRESFEYAEEHIPGAVPHPLSAFDPDGLPAATDGQRLVFQCRSGKRSCDAAERLAAAHGAETFHLAGGIEGWKAAGLTVHRSAIAPPIPVMRQVQIVAGSLGLLGTVLGATVHPGWLILPGFIGAGLTFAGVSGWCGLARVLGAMPWNRRAASSAAPTPTCNA